MSESLPIEKSETRPRYDRHPDCFDGVALALQECWGGVVMGMSIVAVIVYVAISYYSLSSGVGVLLVLVLGLAIFPLIGIVVGAFWSVFGALFVLVLNWSFWELFDRRTAVSIMGGATGMLTTCWAVVGENRFSDLAYLVFAYALIWLAVGLGQIGGLYWGKKRGSFFKPLEFAQDGSIVDPKTITKAEPFQFKITHMFIATIWISVIFALDQLTEGYVIVLQVGVYLLCQLFWLAFDWILRLIFRKKPA